MKRRPKQPPVKDGSNAPAAMDAEAVLQIKGKRLPMAAYRLGGGPGILVEA